MTSMRQILVPTDFSPASDIALQYALDLAQRLGSAIHLLHVVDGTSFAAAYPDGIYVEVPGLRQRLIDEANDQLTKVAARCSAAGFAATGEVMVGSPALVIAEKASERNSDVIVMGTHGRGAFAHLLLGSVAERVLRLAPCAVLTVRDTSRLADVLAQERATASTGVGQ